MQSSNSDENLIKTIVETELHKHIPERATIEFTFTTGHSPTLRCTIKEWPLDSKIDRIKALTDACLSIQEKYGCRCWWSDDDIIVSYTREMGCCRKVAFLIAGSISLLAIPVLFVASIWAVFFQDTL